MTRWMRFAIFLVLTCTSCAARGQEPAAASLFNPSKHMRVAEVRSGMKGYGLSVFQGSTIDQFEVEVVSVLHNFNPKYDVILIRCKGANLEKTGPVAGMSGSPIYLTDDQSRSRLVGAFAYGWPLLKEPLAGVQPIEYMLEVGATLKPEAAATQQSGGLNAQPSGTKLAKYDPLNPLPKNHPLNAMLAPSGNRPISLTGSGDVSQLQPLSTPLMTAGISSSMVNQLGSMFRNSGLVLLQSGAMGGSAPATQSSPDIAPGSVLAAPLLTGDVEMTAIGTCTEVLGDRIFGFGHPFNNEGPITLPMGSGYINGVIPTLSQSFKIGAMAQLRGTLIADQAVGVAGRLGKSPPTIPIDLHVTYTDGSMDVNYHFNAAAHPRLTPVLSAAAVSAALSGRRDLPQYHTVDYTLSLKFANDKTVEMKNIVVNDAGPLLSMQLAGPIVFAADNPFERVMLKSVTGTIRITPEAHEADILAVSLPKLKYRPGDTVKAFVRYRPFRAGESIMPVELELPHDLRDGKYRLSVCDRGTFVQEEQMVKPFRFTAESIEDVFDVLKDVSAIRQNALYVRLLRQADGIAVGRTAMPLLPSSRRQVFLNAGRSNITSYVSSAVKIIPTETIMNGSADFEIEIEPESHVEGGFTPPARSEPRSPTVVIPAGRGSRAILPREEPLPMPPEGP